MTASPTDHGVKVQESGLLRGGRWVDFDGATYVEHEGDAELLPGMRLLPAPGHTDGHQVVVVETGGRPVVVGGDVAVWLGESSTSRPPRAGCGCLH